MGNIVVEQYQTSDFDTVRSFVEAIQEHERTQVPELKPGVEIRTSYTKLLIEKTTTQQGLILLARSDNAAVGFVCGWIGSDDDPLLRDDARRHAYISDLFVDERYRRQGVARLLLEAIEKAMLQRGCERIRICTKASNKAALSCYEASGYGAYEITLSKQLAT